MERKNGKKLLNLLIGQNDSLDVQLLDEFFLRFKRVEMT